MVETYVIYVLVVFGALIFGLILSLIISNRRIKRITTKIPEEALGRIKAEQIKSQEVNDIRGIRKEKIEERQDGINRREEQYKAGIRTRRTDTRNRTAERVGQDQAATGHDASKGEVGKLDGVQTQDVVNRRSKNRSVRKDSSPIKLTKPTDL